MCNINTIRQFIIEVRYEGVEEEYQQDIATGDVHECDGSNQDECGLCYLIVNCDCEDVLQSQSEVEEYVFDIQSMDYDESEVLGDPEAYYGSSDSDDTEESELDVFTNPIHEDVFRHEMSEFEHDPNLAYHYVLFMHGLSSYDKALTKIALKEPIRKSVIELISYRNDKNQFIDTIHEELIQQAMHPCRIQYSMSHCDDIEGWFNAIAY